MSLLEISSEMVIANLFAGGKKFITGKDLYEVRRGIESVTRNVYIEITADYVQYTIHNNSFWFRYGDEKKGENIDYIYPVDHKKFTDEFCDKYFNWMLSEENRKLLLPILRGEIEKYREKP